MLAYGAIVSGAVWAANTFVAPTPARMGSVSSPVGEVVDVGSPVVSQSLQSETSVGSGFGALSAVVLAGVVASARQRRTSKLQNKAQSSVQPAKETISFGRGGFTGSTADAMSVISVCPRTGRAVAQRVGAVSAAATPSDTRCAINGFGRIGRNVLRSWIKRDQKPFDIVAINVGSMDTKTAAHLLKYDTVLGKLDAEVSVTEDTITVDGNVLKIVTGRDPKKMGWGELGVEVVIESTGAFNSLDGGAQHLEAGAKKVVLTAPGKNCPTYVVGVNEQDYDAANDNVISNASCTTNAMAAVCKLLDESFGVEYGVMTTTHAYTGDQMMLDGRHSDLRRARAGACNIIPTSTGAAEAVAKVLPQLKGKLTGIALRVPTPNVSVVDLVVKVDKKCTKEDVNAALKAAANGPMKGILHFEEQPLVSSDFLQSDFSSSVDAGLTTVMGEDLIKVILWYDNEWGYSQRVLDLTSIVAEKLTVAA